MILKSKIEEACNRTCNEGVGLRVHNDSLKRSLFKAGVSFAEKEIENSAIEFAEWIFDNDVFDDFAQAKKSTEKLFEIFKQEKYESNK